MTLSSFKLPPARYVLLATFVALLLCFVVMGGKHPQPGKAVTSMAEGKPKAPSAKPVKGETAAPKSTVQLPIRAEQPPGKRPADATPVASSTGEKRREIFKVLGRTTGEPLDPKSASFVQAKLEGRTPEGRVTPLNPESLAAISTLRRGDQISLALTDREAVEAKVNLSMTEADGTVRVGGSLATGTGSFSLRRTGTVVSGVIELPEKALAFKMDQDAAGSPLIREVPLSSVICYQMPGIEGQEFAASEASPDAPTPAVPLLNSRPAAIAQLYLDFDGETVTDPGWNGGQTINAAAYDLSADQITTIFNGVKEDYQPFDVNITTDVARYNSAPVGKRMRCIITSTANWYPDAGGVAKLNSFSLAGSYYSSTVPCWVFNPTVRGIAEAISHELGHTFGLKHDGLTSPAEEYYSPRAPDSTWAPIMGAGYYVNVVQWSKGEYANANNQEDDVAIISNATNGFGYAADDAGDTAATAVPVGSASPFTRGGMISGENDTDYYFFTTSGGAVSISAAPPIGSPTADLDIALELQNSAQAVVASSNPVGPDAASISVTLAAGTYYVKVSGSGALDPLTNGYTKYGSFGAYTLSGSGNFSATPTNFTDMDGTFESPAIWNFQYTPAVSATQPWTFGVSTGIANPPSGFGVSGGVTGQYAFLQGNGASISQTVYFPTAGSYELFYNYAGRDFDSGTTHFSVSLSGGLLSAMGSTVSGQEFSRHGDAFTVSSPGTYTLTFANMTDGDQTFYVDGVVIARAPAATPQTVTALEDTPRSITLGGIAAEAAIVSASYSGPPAHGHLTSTDAQTVTYTPDPNYNGNDSFTFYVTDSSGATSAPATVTINIIAVNDPPSFSIPGSLSVANTGASTTVGFATNISAGPPDEAGQGLQFWTTTTSNTSLFSVLPFISPTGTLTFTPVAGTYGTATVSTYLIDYGGTANGGNNLSATQTFTISVTPPAPYIEVQGGHHIIGSGYFPSVVYDTDFGGVLPASGTVVHSFLIINRGTGTLLLSNVSVGGANAADFNVTTQPASSVAPGDGTTFQVTFDPSTNGLRSATLSFTNNAPYFNPFQFGIQGTGLNSAPTAILLSATSIAENNAANATVATLSATDADSGDAPVFSLVNGSGSTDNASFTIAGTALKLTPSADFETKSSYAIRIGVDDGHGSTLESPFTITITDVVEAPVVTTPTFVRTSPTAASLGGNVAFDGGTAITERGVVYAATATNAAPSIGGAGVTKVTAGGTTGAFTAAVSGLSPSTGYSFKAYATNAQGTSYSSVGSFTSASGVAFTYMAATDVPVTAAGYDASGSTATLALGYAPVAGTNLMVVKNTGLPFITGAFNNLVQGQSVVLSYGGVNYSFVVNYYGGSGNDLVLQWSNLRPLAWGKNEYGQLGNNSTTDSHLPAAVLQSGVLAGKTVIAVSAQASHTLALCSDGTVAAWGRNDFGQLGNNSNKDSSVPVAVDRSGVLAGKTVIAVAGGIVHSLALCSDGTVAAWGYDGQGQLGTSALHDSWVPAAVDRSGVLAGKKVVAVSVRSQVSLVLCSDGTLATWGQYVSDQPVAVAQTGALVGKTIIAISTGFLHTLVLCSDGTVAAWGNNNNGQVGNGSYENSINEPVLVDRSGVLAGKTVTAVIAGGFHSLALCSDGTVAAWGTNFEGELGTGSSSPSTWRVPVAVQQSSGVLAGKTVISVRAGISQSLAFCSDGTLAAWGQNGYGQLGNDSTADSSVPVVVSTTALAAGERFVPANIGPDTYHSLSLVAAPPPIPLLTAISPTSGSNSGGTAATITGTNFTGATAVTIGGTAATGVTVVSDTTITCTLPAHAAGAASVLVTTPIGTNPANTLFSYVAPFALTATFNAASDVPATSSSYYATGSTATLALNYAPVAGTSLTVVKNTGLDFINGTFSNLAQGQAVSLSYGGVTYNFVANYYGGTGNDLVLQWASVRPLAWGYNVDGALGNGSKTLSTVPVAVLSSGVLAGKTVIALAAGSYHSLALCADGTLAAWGSNRNGQLGNGGVTGITTENMSQGSSVPVAVLQTGVLAGKTVIAVAAGNSHSLALCSDGSLAAWGYNGSGELGNNSTTQSNVPVAVPQTGVLAGKTVIAISGGDRHTLALCADGTVAAWGYNGSGELGNNSTANSLVPVAVDTSGVLAGKTVIAVAAGGEHSLALCADGTVVAWGWATVGQLGNNNSMTQSNVPVAVDTSGVLAGKTVIAIAAGYYHSLALCADGTVAAWGFNTVGQSGNGSTTQSNVPVAVDQSGVLSGKTVVAIAAGRGHSVALCSDGTTAAWGANSSGQLGNNSTTNSSLPVAVDTSSLASGEHFCQLGAGSVPYHTLALVATPPAVPKIAVSGNSVDIADGDSTPSTADFTDFGGSATTGGTVLRSFTIGNNGGGDLTLGGVTVGGIHAADFSVTTQPATSVAAGGSTTFQITFNPSANGLRSAMLSLANNDGSTPPFTFSIQGAGLNTAPTAILLSATSIAENNAANATVGTLSDTDVDATDVPSFSLVSGTGSTDNASFTLSGTTLKLTPSADFETKSSYAIRISADDGQGASLESPFTITITDANDAPTALTLSANTLAENVPANSAVGTLSTTDADAGDTFSYTLVAGAGSTDNAAFSISDATLLLTASPDFETQSGYSVRVRTTDAGGLKFENSFTITITDVPELPLVTTPTSAGIAATAATLGGNVTSDGGAAITERGVVYAATATNNNPTIGGTGVTKVTAGGTTGVFTAAITGLSPGLGYSFKAYATNAQGTSYTSAGSFSTSEALIFTFTAAADVAVTASSFTASSGTATLSLGYAPVPGTNLTVVKNTGLGFMTGAFSNLAQGQAVVLTYGGVKYHFVANYYGGSGNDLVLQWANVRPMAWGNNTYGQLGNNNKTQSNLPTAVLSSGVLSGKTVIAVAEGGFHSLALCSDGTVAAWGYNLYGQLGNNSYTQSNVPVAVVQSGALAGKTVIAIAAGAYHNLALCSDGTVAAWGYNLYGQLGNNSYTQSNVPVTVLQSSGVLSGKTVIAISAGLHHSLALCADGTLAAWGRNSEGELGNNSTTGSNVPVAVVQSGVLSGKSVIAATAGQQHNLALCSDGTVAAWGYNSFGQLGNNSTAQSNVPVAVVQSGVLSGKTVSALAAGYGCSLVLCVDGTLAAWGRNVVGELGNSSNAQSLVPVAVLQSGVLSGKTVIGIAVGAGHCIALCSDGSLAAWGDDSTGQLGNNDTAPSNVPVAVITTPLAAGERFTTASIGSCAAHTLALVAAPPPPTATTDPASSITAGSALLNGTVNANGSATTVTFQFGLTTNYVQTGTASQSPVSGTSDTAVSLAISGLSPGATYHYRVVAVNGGPAINGSDATFTVPPSTNASLSGLVVNTATLSPSFASGTLSYTATVPNATASVTVKPTAAQTNATIKVNTVTVATGATSGAIVLNVGTNTLTTVVTAQDGTTTQTYTVVITRQSAFHDWAVANNVSTDPAANGGAGLLSFASGTTPTTSGQALVYTGTFAGGGTISAKGSPITRMEQNGTDIRAVFVRRKDYAAAGLTYTPQFTSDLTTWVDNATPPTVLADDGTHQIVSVPYPATAGGKPARFFRISVGTTP